jgi:uncharacterized protein YceH (UPF0502 family)
VELTPAQGRVLGALVEKERTTPQAYPLTDNALVAACNQTTSRDPVVSFDIATVRIAVRELRELGLVRTVHRSGERTDKHRHELEAGLGLSPAQTALLAVLLLRGPQTLAELRARSERLEAFATVDDVERELAVMADRDEPLVGLMARQPGRKEARFEQLLATAAPPAGAPQYEAAVPPGPPQYETAAAAGAPQYAAVAAAGPVRMLSDASAAPAREARPAPPPPAEESGLSGQVSELAAEVAELRQEVARLRARLEQVTG